MLLLDMGVTGLVISLLLSRTMGTAIAFGYLLKYSPSLRFKIKDSLKLNFSTARKILYVGIPFASEQLFFNGGKLLIQTFIVQFGTMALTANAIGSSLAMLFQTGSNALSIAIVTVVGQCIGRNDIQEGRKVVSQAGVILNFWLCPPAGYSAGGSNQFPFSANVPHSLCLPVYHKHGMLKMKKGAVGQHDSPRTTAASRAVGLYGLTTK